MPETMTTGLRRAGYVTVAKVANQLRGLSNSEIASEFFVSEATVKTHVGNM
jgi:DNA-binding CsgD family transcriptional regulator